MKIKNEIIKSQILDNIYLSQEERIDEIIKRVLEEVKDKLAQINKQEFLNKYKDKEIKDFIETLEENKNIEIGYLIKEIYKQGFTDGVNLMIECMDKKHKKMT